MLIGTYFLMNLFVGVIFLRFMENRLQARKKHRIKGSILSDVQQKWIEMQRMIVLIKPDLRSGPPQNKYRLFFYRIVSWGGMGSGVNFDICIIIVIVGNIIVMALPYEGSPASYDLAINNINFFFTAVFIFEFLAKVIGLGFKRYWLNPWNKFDFFVVSSSIVDIIMNILGNGNFYFLRIGPQLARVVRVLRVSRLMKLIRNLPGLQKILQTLLFSLPSLMNVLALLFLVFFMFAVLGVFLFSDVTQGSIIGSYVNFSNFGNAMLTLFRCSTGENWWTIMSDTITPTLCKDGTTNCGSRKFSFLYAA